jgi:hypothetical protein
VLLFHTGLTGDLNGANERRCRYQDIYIDGFERPYPITLHFRTCLVYNAMETWKPEEKKPEIIALCRNEIFKDSYPMYRGNKAIS